MIVTTPRELWEWMWDNPDRPTQNPPDPAQAHDLYQRGLEAGLKPSQDWGDWLTKVREAGWDASKVSPTAAPALTDAERSELNALRGLLADRERTPSSPTPDTSGS